MELEISVADVEFNTQYAPLAALWAAYQADQVLQPLQELPIVMKKRDFTPADKLMQVLLSILAGCETLSEVNTRLKRESYLARACGWPRFADQSNLSRMLDALTLKQIEQLRQRSRQIWWNGSQIHSRDWRKHLWLDFDLSGLTCSAEAEESEKGYFSGKKTQPGVN